MYLSIAKSLKLDYLINTIETCIKYSDIKSHQMKDNIFYITKLDSNNNPIDLTIKCEIIDDILYRYSVKFPSGGCSEQCSYLNLMIPDIMKLSYYNSGNILPIFDFSHSQSKTVCENTIRVVISNIILFLKKCGIRFLKHVLYITNNSIKLHTLWYGVSEFAIYHAEPCQTTTCLIDNNLLLFDNGYHSIRDLSDSNMFDCLVFKQLGIQLQNDKVKCLKVLMLTKLLVKKYLCNDLFTDIGTLIYKTSFGEECITGFE